MVDNRDTCRRLQALIHSEIPLARAMDVHVSNYDGNCLTLEAPLSANQNHKRTAFGGSLYSLAVLTGWGLLHLKLQESALQAHIVIYEARVSYESPVTGTLVARCTLPEPATFERVLRSLGRKGMARIPLIVELPGAESTAASFHGTYVIHN